MYSKIKVYIVCYNPGSTQGRLAEDALAKECEECEGASFARVVFR